MWGREISHPRQLLLPGLALGAGSHPLLPTAMRFKLLKHTRLNVVAFLNELPKTQHDINSFVVDVCAQTVSVPMLGAQSPPWGCTEGGQGPSPLQACTGAAGWGTPPALRVRCCGGVGALGVAGMQQLRAHCPLLPPRTRCCALLCTGSSRRVSVSSLPPPRGDPLPSLLALLPPHSLDLLLSSPSQLTASPGTQYEPSPACSLLCQPATQGEFGGGVALLSLPHGVWGTSSGLGTLS